MTNALMRAWRDTFTEHIGRTIFIILFGALAVLATVGFLLGPSEAVVQVPFIVAGIVGAFAPLAVLFFWSLACAPYRIERDAHKDTRLRLDRAEADQMKPIDWSAWRGRSHFTLKEAACIMAGVEPSSGPLKGAAYGYAQELRWAVAREEINTEISAIIRVGRRMAPSDGHASGDSVPDSEKIIEASFVTWLMESNHKTAKMVLANLGEDDLLKLHQGSAAKTRR